MTTLHAQGLTRRAIARALQVSRNTVRKMLSEHATAHRLAHSALPVPAARTPRPQKLDAFRGKVTELLARYPQITAQRVFEELRAAGFDGGYTAVKRHVRVVRPPPAPTPSLPTPLHGPGELAESDWSPHTIDFTGARRETVQIFSYVLAFSRRKSFSVFARCDLHSLMDGHLAAFARFGALARICKYDGQKAVVLGWEGRQPIYNPRFLAFATHYSFRPEACRPFHPNDKPVVERGFWEFERSFLNGRSFRDVDDLRAQLARWQSDVADVRTHKKTRRPVIEMFDEEKPHLLALPAHPYDTARVVYRVCSIDGFVAFDGNRYAVPYEHVTDILPVRVTQTELFVYAADLRRIACHELAPRGAGMTVAPPGSHPPWKTAVVDLDQLRVAFEKMGPQAALFIAGLATAQPRLGAYHARQILLLRERYATADLEGALAHAHRFGAFDHNAVARILAARAAPRTLAEYVAEDAARRLEERLGDCDTAPRDLEEYDRLPLSSPNPPLPQQLPCPSETLRQTPTQSPSACDDPCASSD
jgi:transposase